jgi:hypothetical protein
LGREKEKEKMNDGMENIALGLIGFLFIGGIFWSIHYLIKKFYR